MSVPRESDLFTADKTLDLENWLLTRLNAPQLFNDPPCLTAEYRQARVRALIVTRDLEWAIAGKSPAGKTETWGDLFERVYGEPLHFAPRRTTTRGSSRKKGRGGNALRVGGT